MAWRGVPVARENISSGIRRRVRGVTRSRGRFRGDRFFRRKSGEEGGGREGGEVNHVLRVFDGIKYGCTYDRDGRSPHRS